MDFPAGLRASNDAGIEFLRTELSLAHTFLNVATATKHPERRLQSLEHAHEAYRAILRFLPRLQLSAKQKLDFDRQLAVLKEQLMLAGIEP